MEPIFARLGVKHVSRNIANGGLGTTQNGIASAAFHGPDVSLLMWDSGMTENNLRDPDMMARQGLMGGFKVPYLIGFPGQVMKKLHDLADVDVATLGNAYSGLPLAETVEDLDGIVWAAKYMRCSTDIGQSFCRPNEYNGTCWIDRPDYTPTQTQSIHPGGRASWHPGNRAHQLTGRVIAMLLLQATHEVLVTWSQTGGQLMPDEAWHLTGYYENIRTKVMAIKPEDSPCYSLQKDFPNSGFENFCKYPMKVRTRTEQQDTQCLFVYSCVLCLYYTLSC
jgi:hypothetical protein